MKYPRTLLLTCCVLLTSLSPLTGAAAHVQNKAADTLSNTLTSTQAAEICGLTDTKAPLADWAYADQYLLCRSDHTTFTETLVYQSQPDMSFTQILQTNLPCDANCLFNKYTIPQDTALRIDALLLHDSHIDGMSNVTQKPKYVAAHPLNIAMLRLPANYSRSGPMQAKVKVHIGIDGTVTDASMYLSSGDRAVDSIVLRCARTSEYSPARLNGQAIPGFFVFTASFNTQ